MVISYNGAAPGRRDDWVEASKRDLPLTVAPGANHWGIFVELCEQAAACGGLISDAYLAAMAMEMGAELVTDDRGFGRWPGLRWRHPLDE